MKTSRKTNLKERIQIAKECIESGNDYGGIAKKYDVTYQQVYTWVKKFTKLGNAGLDDRRGRRKKIRSLELQKKNLRLRLQS